jgi:hypothetical protein
MAILGRTNGSLSLLAFNNENAAFKWVNGVIRKRPALWEKFAI